MLVQSASADSISPAFCWWDVSPQQERRALAVISPACASPHHHESNLTFRIYLVTIRAHASQPDDVIYRALADDALSAKTLPSELGELMSFGSCVRPVTAHLHSCAASTAETFRSSSLPAYCTLTAPHP